MKILKNLNEEEIKTIWNFILFISFALLLFSGVYIFSMFHGAKSFCSSVNGTYTFEYSTLNHLCNEEYIYEYNNGWDFEKPNVNEIKIILNRS